MARKGITNLSDFIRQSVVAEIARLEREEALATVSPEQLARARQYLESQVTLPVAPPALPALGDLRDLPAVSPEQAQKIAAAQALATLPPELAKKLAIAAAQAAIPPKLWSKIQAAQAEAACPPLHVKPTSNPTSRSSNPSRRPRSK